MTYLEIVLERIHDDYSFREHKNKNQREEIHDEVKNIKVQQKNKSYFPKNALFLLNPNESNVTSASLLTLSFSSTSCNAFHDWVSIQ